MAIPADGEITAAMLVLLDKPRREQVFPDPYFYVKELRLAVNAHLTLEKILEVVEPLAEGFDGQPRKAVVEVHQMAEDRERKVIILAGRTVATLALDPTPVPRRGHARSDSELAYLQETTVPTKREVADIAPSQSVPVKKGVRISEEDNTEKTMSLVISNPTTIDHNAQAVGGSILKGPAEPSEVVKPPGSLEVLRQTLGRPSKDWPTWPAAAVVEATPPLVAHRATVEPTALESAIHEVHEEQDWESSAKSADPAKAQTLSPAPSTPPSPYPTTPHSPTVSIHSVSSLQDAIAGLDGDVSDVASSLSIDSEDDLLLSDVDTLDAHDRVPPTPLIKKAFDGVTIGSVKPEEASAAMKDWFVKKWKYIALDLGLVVGLAIFLHLIGM